jgi:NAD(P)H-dependent FMN reductase
VAGIYTLVENICKTPDKCSGFDVLRSGNNPKATILRTIVMKKLRILAISGSLRPQSSNHKLLKLVASMAPENVEFLYYDGIASLAHFDGAEEPPLPVQDFLRQVRDADGVFICTPEYAFGVPGSLKNALDWTVGNGEFADKHVAYITAATGGEKAHESLGFTLTAMQSKIADGGTLLISFIRAKLDKQGEVIDPQLKESIRSVLSSLIVAIQTDKITA